MLRMGKNPTEDKSQPDTDSYSTRSSYSPYQSGETQTRPATETATTLKALTESETIAREIKDGTLSGFVGSGTTITGESTFKSMLRVDGRFSGRITSETGTLIVGAGGQVDANIEVSVCTIHGIVNGDIIASERIELGRAAKLTGNIQTPSLVIEPGAVFEGSSKMAQMKTAVSDKSPKVERKDNILDSSKLEAVKVDGSGRKAEDGSNSKPVSVTAAAS